MTCLTFTLEHSRHKFHPGWRETKGPLSKEASGTLQYFLRVSENNDSNTRKWTKKEWNQKQFLQKFARSPMFFCSIRYTNIMWNDHYFFILIFDKWKIIILINEFQRPIGTNLGFPDTVIYIYMYVYLTIIPWARMGSKSVAHEAEGRMGYWPRGHEGERNNYCFSKIQLVGQKNIEAKHLLLVKARF